MIKKLTCIILGFMILFSCKQPNDLFNNAKTTSEIIELKDGIVLHFNKIEVDQLESMLFIYIEYQLDKDLSSSRVTLLDRNNNKYEYYSGDGLDYLGGMYRAEIPFVRFMVNLNIKEYLIIFDNSIYIYYKVS